MLPAVKLATDCVVNCCSPLTGWSFKVDLRPHCVLPAFAEPVTATIAITF